MFFVPPPSCLSGFTRGWPDDWSKQALQIKKTSGWLKLSAGVTRKKASTRRVNRKIADSTRNQRVFFSRYLAANYDRAVAAFPCYVLSSSEMLLKLTWIFCCLPPFPPSLQPRWSFSNRSLCSTPETAALPPSTPPMPFDSAPPGPATPPPPHRYRPPTPWYKPSASSPLQPPPVFAELFSERWPWWAAPSAPVCCPGRTFRCVGRWRALWWSFTHWLLPRGLAARRISQRAAMRFGWLKFEDTAVLREYNICEG